MENMKYDKYPAIPVNGEMIWKGWDSINKQLKHAIEKISGERKILVFECYHGVNDNEIAPILRETFPDAMFVESSQLFKPVSAIEEMVYPDVTDDAIFGYMTRLNMEDYFDEAKINDIRKNINGHKGTVVIYGPGASLVTPHRDLLVYFDMARWEIQSRMRGNEINNLGLQNKEFPFNLKYKQGYFVDWRVCDRLKKKLFDKMDFLIDTNKTDDPKMISGTTFLKAIESIVQRPFRVVPFFDPGPWGGQWMKEVFDLDRSVVNYAWAFDCVPEENSLLLDFGDAILEIPSINLVFLHPKELLGENVYGRFGDEFPIRFDFLDTMGGGNLSLQVHPLTGYIREKFGMQYTQDESYYIMESKPGAVAYLGLKKGIDRQSMISDLKAADKGLSTFDTDKYVNTFPVKKHDHLSIPAGTIHCSGADTVVLEISATPYIFTFKLWDWGRLGLDGKPRPINIEHGKNVLQWDRDTSWVEKNALNLVEKIEEGDGYVKEKTGLNESEFIETHRYWFRKKVTHHTCGSVNVLNLVEGDAIVVESPHKSFESFEVHYAETFIVPAAIGEYTVRPFKEDNNLFGIIKAFVRP